MPKKIPLPKPGNRSYTSFVLLAILFWAFNGVGGNGIYRFMGHSADISLSASTTKQQSNTPNLPLLSEIEESEDETQHGYRKKNPITGNHGSANPTHKSAYHPLDENRKNLQRQAIPLFIWNHCWKNDPGRLL